MVDVHYGGWKKSCTTLDGWNPINNGIDQVSTGAGFLPSTVCFMFKPSYLHIFRVKHRRWMAWSCYCPSFIAPRHNASGIWQPRRIETLRKRVVSQWEIHYRMVTHQSWVGFRNPMSTMVMSTIFYHRPQLIKPLIRQLSCLSGPIHDEQRVIFADVCGSIRDHLHVFGHKETLDIAPQSGS